MKLKILKLQPFMELVHNPKWGMSDSYEVLPFSFNRDGWYLHGDLCWFEFRGTAYKSSILEFNNALEILNVKCFRDCELRAFELLEKERLLNLKQLKDLNTYRLKMELKAIASKSKFRGKQCLARLSLKLLT